MFLKMILYSNGCMCVCVRGCMHSCTWLHAFVCVLCLCVYVRAFDVYACLPAYRGVCVRVCIHACMHSCIRMSICAYMYV